MKRFLCLLLSAALICVSVGCYNDKDVVIKYDLFNSIESLDPQTVSNQASQVIISSIFEGLFRIDASGELQNALAESYHISSDGLTYTFVLRKDSKWAYIAEDGDIVQIPVTAKDFKFAFQRLFMSNTHSEAASRFFCIKNAKKIFNNELDMSELGVYADSDYDLRIELFKADDNFINLLSTTYAMPCNEDFFNQTMGRYGLEKGASISNGPFKVFFWTSGEKIFLGKNENYWNSSEVIPDKVDFYLNRCGKDISEKDYKRKRLLNGDVDAAFIDAGINKFSDRGYHVESIENSVWGLYFNQKNKDLANINIRKAIAATFERKKYCNNLSENLITANALLPHDIVLFGNNFRSLAGEDIVSPFDPEYAFNLYKKGLSELDKTGLDGVRLLVNKDDASDVFSYFNSVSQVLQKELSLFISVDSVSNDEYEARIISGNFDIAFYQISSNDNTPWSILSNFMSGNSQNYASYKNPTLDASLTSAVSASEEEKIVNGYISAEQIIIDDVVFIPMFYAKNYFVVRPEITGVVYNKQTGLVDFSRANRD